MKLRELVFLLVGIVFSFPFYGQTPDDNILIERCEDSYVFFEEDGIPQVRNKKETTYLASRMGTTFQSAAFYGEYISLDGVSVKGGNSSKAQHKSATPENIFFDDTKVCFFQITLDRKGKSCQTTFKRTFHDLRYFTKIYLSEDFFIKEKKVTFTIPASLSHYRFQEMNFPANIRVNTAKDSQGNTQITYTIVHLPGMKQEEGMPPVAQVYPHLLITGSFTNHEALYQWSNQLAQVDCHIPELPALIQEITLGSNQPMEQIRRTYAWVQQNIRYVAFEAGISGFRPDTPAEVLRKRYGDCKGMSLLLCTLLKAQGFDARLTDIGTDDIPFRITEYPILAATNHMICTVFHEGKTYYLDATHNYIPIEFIPESIQGREALIEDGAHCLVQSLPILPPATSTDSIHCNFTLAIQGGEAFLQGTAERHWSGQLKELFMYQFQNSSADQREEILQRVFCPTEHFQQAEEVSWQGNEPIAQWTCLSGHYRLHHAAQMADKEIYLEADLHNDPFAITVDTLKRIHDYQLPLRCHIIRETLITLPAGYNCTYLPQGIILHLPQGMLSCSFHLKNRRILFRKVMEINRKMIQHSELSAWNQALQQWTEACSEQVILSK